MQLRVISDKCIACGKCYLKHEDLFDCDDDGIAYVIAPNIDPTSYDDEIKSAILSCPTKAIRFD